MTLKILGNILALIACLLMLFIGLIKEKKKVLTCQCIQLGFNTLANLALGAPAGTVCNFLNILRNIVFLKYSGTWLKIGFIGAQILITGFFWTGSMELLPILTSIIFIWSLDTIRNDRFKVVNIITLALWLIYDFYYQNYVASVFDLLTIGSNCIALLAIRKQKQ